MVCLPHVRTQRLAGSHPKGGLPVIYYSSPPTHNVVLISPKGIAIATEDVSSSLVHKSSLVTSGENVCFYGGSYDKV